MIYQKEKIIPALFNRFIDQLINTDFDIICIGRENKNQEIFKQEIIQFIKSDDDKKLNSFLKNISFLQIPTNSIECYKPLKTFLNSKKERQSIFYLSVPSSAIHEICKTLNDSKLIYSNSKVVLEKPLGNSLLSSKEINTIISDVFLEKQIFRIDHYLGKETVQNIMVLRFANYLFERSWNGESIENIQITVAESLGVEKRIGYYDSTGALLDMVQNHLLQLLCLVTMEPPASLNPDAVRNEKLKVLQSLRPLQKNQLKKILLGVNIQEEL